MTRPNVLGICTDQRRFDTLGCYGNPFVRTPHLDRLAEGGLLFERCFAQSPVCSPSRRNCTRPLAWTVDPLPPRRAVF